MLNKRIVELDKFTIIDFHKQSIFNMLCSGSVYKYA